MIKNDYVIISEDICGKVSVEASYLSEKDYPAILDEAKKKSKRIIFEKYGIRLDYNRFMAPALEINRKPISSVSKKIEDLVQNIPEINEEEVLEKR